MSFLDWVVPIATAGSAIYSASQAGKAADAQVDAARDAGQQSLAIYQQQRKDALPWMDTGQQALYALADLYGVPRVSGVDKKGNPIFTKGKAFTGTPGYQFRLQEGVNALDRSAAARGRLNSGAQMKALTQYGQNLASEEFGNYTNALRSLSGQGQVANQAIMGAGNNYATNAGNALMNAGAARASGYGGQAQAINQGIGNALYWYSR